MTITSDSSKGMQYIFLAVFLIVYLGIVIFSIVKNKSASNRSSPTRRDYRDVPFYEKIVAIVLVSALPCAAISIILFENLVVGGVSIGLFMLVIIAYNFLAGINKVAVSTHAYGAKATIYYSTKEFEARLLEGTIDLTNCTVKFPKGYKPPKTNEFSSPDNDDPFAKYD